MARTGVDSSENVCALLRATSVCQSFMSSHVSFLFLAMAPENMGREGTVKRKHGFLGLETELFPNSITTA